MQLSVIYVFALLVRALLGAGVLVHNEILRQAAYTLSLPPTNASLPLAGWLEQNRASSQPGAFFPDWGYGCLDSDDAAEMAHWPPFLSAALRYLHNTYPDLQNDERAQQLLAFLLAIASHQTADSTWHSIRFRDGLLRVMAAVDFDGDIDAAHPILDIGGDTIMAHIYASQSDDAGFDYLSQVWKVPINDILAIYKMMGVSVNSIKLRYCISRGFAALSALRRVGGSLAARYAQRSPFMVHQMEHFYRGSIQEAAVSILPCWKMIEKLLSTGQIPNENDIWDYCEPMRTIRARGKPYLTHAASRKIREQVVFANTCSCDEGLLQDFEMLVQEELSMIVETEEHGILTLSTQPFLKHEKQYRNLDLSRPHAPDVHEEPYFLSPNVPYSFFGKSVTFVSGGSGRDIAVSAPLDVDDSSDTGRGSVYIISLQPASLIATSKSLPCGPGRLGPFRSNSSRTVPLYFGTSLVNLTLAGEQILAVLSYHQVELFRTMNGTLQNEAFLTIRRSSAPDMFGDSPIASDLTVFKHDGQTILALLAPWTGRASQGAVYLFSQNVLLNSTKLILENADHQQYGINRYERLGLSLTYLDQRKLLVVGSARQVSFYKFQENSLKRIWQIHDPSQQKLDTGFGTALLAEDNYLYIASPDEQDGSSAQAGKVRVFHLAPLFSSRGRSLQVPWTITLAQVITSSQPLHFAHFGQTLTAAGHRDGVYIGAPGYDNRGALFYLPALKRKQKKGLKQRPIGFITEMIAAWFPGPLYKRQQAERAEYAAQQIQSSRSYEPQTRLVPRRGHKIKPMYNVTLAPCILGYEAGSAFGSAIASSMDGLVVVGAPTSAGFGVTARHAGRVLLYEGLRC
jgi:hypothetical protein